jgi:hypothetical protein
MNDEYLNRVLIFLQQELPGYKAQVVLKAGKFVFTLPDGTAFQPWYESLFSAISTVREGYEIGNMIWTLRSGRRDKSGILGY